MLKAIRDRWETFWTSEIAETVNLQSDLSRLNRWIEATDEYDRVSKVFRKSRLVLGSTGQPVLNPLAGYLAQLERQISRAETEFGMTPMARLRLGIALGEAARSLEGLNREIGASDDEDDSRIAAADPRIIDGSTA